jgi:putative ABC transport system permease protein
MWHNHRNGQRNATMLYHFFKIIFRYLSRKAFFTALNIVGLSIGLASCIVIFLFVTHEWSYDKFHEDGKHIYRVLRQSEINHMPYDIGVTAAPFGPALKQDFSNVIQSTTRVLPFDALVTYKDQSFIEDKLLLADDNFFKFFSFPVTRIWSLKQ